MSIEELFRAKLEHIESVPSVSAGNNLMRRLRYREFLRFNPARFNVYYLGIILSALIAGGILLFSENESDKENSDPSGQIQIPGEVFIQKGDNISLAQEVSVAEITLAEPSASIEGASSNDIETDDLIKNIDTTRQESWAGTITENITITSFSPINNTLRERSFSSAPLFTPSVTEGCAPLSVSFKLNNVYESYSWKFGKDGVSGNSNPVWVFDREGIYDVVLDAVSGGTVYTWSTTIKVYPKPLASFTLSPGKPSLPEDEVSFVNYSVDGISYDWDFGDGSGSTQFEPRHRYEKYDNYNVRLLVKSDNGCIDTALLSNAYTGDQFYIDMPNAFIPNPFGPSGGYYSYTSDESAEIFHPMFSGVSEYKLTVYSKLGMVLFETNDINMGWDGYYNGQLSNPGVYIWKVSGKYRNGIPFNKMGDVTLLKK